MIEINNKSTYQRIYNSFSAVFIDAYCSFRLNGHDSDQSLRAAKISVQNHVAIELSRNRMNPKTVIKAYTNLKSDTKIVKKAIQYYQGLR